jgi:hypothetical protein
MPLQINHPSPPADDASTERSTETPPTLPDDDIFHILQTNRRRDAIRYLLDQDGPVKMRDVAEYVAARENDTTVAQLSSTERQRVYIPLYQSHLPKLDEEGVIEYNKSRGIVKPTDRLELFRPYLELDVGGDEPAADTGPVDSLRQRCTVLAVASAGLLVSATVGVYAAVSAAETSLALAISIGSIAVPGMLLGLIATAMLALTAGTNYGSSTPNDPTKVRPSN